MNDDTDLGLLGLDTDLPAPPDLDHMLTGVFLAADVDDHDYLVDGGVGELDWDDDLDPLVDDAFDDDVDTDFEGDDDDLY